MFVSVLPVNMAPTMSWTYSVFRPTVTAADSEPLLATSIPLFAAARVAK